MVSFAVHLFIDAWPAGWMKTIMDVDRQPKKAYFAYRDALQPLSVSLRTDRFQWSPGEEATVESWICNDRNEIPEGLSLKYQVYVGNKLLVSQAVMPRMEEMRSVLQGLIHFKVPAVSKRTTAKVIVSLESPETVIDQNQLELTLYPQPDQALVKVLCTTPHTAWVNELTQQMGWTKTETMANARVVVVSLEEYQQNKISLDAYVADGGKLLFFNLPEGRQQVGESTVQIEKTIMGDYFFVNPTTELLKAGFTPKDFFLWYDKKTACIEPLVSHLVKAAKWTPLLSSGLTNWGTTEVEGYFACGRLDYGRGAYYICQLLSEGRMAENPAMKLLLNELINNK